MKQTNRKYSIIGILLLLSILSVQLSAYAPEFHPQTEKTSKSDSGKTIVKVLDRQIIIPSVSFSFEVSDISLFDFRFTIVYESLNTEYGKVIAPVISYFLQLFGNQIAINAP